jgi:hypothetical protein
MSPWCLCDQGCRNEFKPTCNRPQSAAKPHLGLERTLETEGSKSESCQVFWNTKVTFFSISWQNGLFVRACLYGYLGLGEDSRKPAKKILWSRWQIDLSGMEFVADKLKSEGKGSIACGWHDYLCDSRLSDDLGRCVCIHFPSLRIVLISYQLAEGKIKKTFKKGPHCWSNNNGWRWGVLILLFVML